MTCWAIRRSIPTAPSRASRSRMLLVVKDDEAYCQPCVSPVWDTALVAHALMEAKDAAAEAAVARGLEWLKPLQVLDVKGDWAEEKPDVRPGGWAFQYRNDHYPDLDDTAVVVMAMDRAEGARRRTRTPSRAAREWVEGLQSQDGGWGAFDADNSLLLSQQHPLRRSWRAARSADRRCLGPLRRHAGAAGRGQDDPRAEGRRRLSAHVPSATDGSWWGRWGVNYIYGTWSALAGLNGAGLAAGRPHDEARRRLAGRRSRIRMAAGARIATATSWITKAMSPRRPRRHRPPGRCWA